MVCVLGFQVLIIEGETGSGKTTQIPQYLYEAVSIWGVEMLLACQCCLYQVVGWREFTFCCAFEHFRKFHLNFYAEMRSGKLQLNIQAAYGSIDSNHS